VQLTIKPGSKGCHGEIKSGASQHAGFWLDDGSTGSKVGGGGDGDGGSEGGEAVRVGGTIRCECCQL
jgi:hypothetical protein